MLTGTGSVESFFKPGAPPVLHDTYDFIFKLAPPRWQVRITQHSLKESLPKIPSRAHPPAPGEVIPVGSRWDYEEVCYDGTNVFDVISIHQNALRERRAGRQVLNDMLAMVEPGPVPQVSELFPTFLWLALASGDYLETRPTNRVELIFPSDRNSTALLHRRVDCVRAVWRLIWNQSPPVPKFIVMLNVPTINDWVRRSDFLHRLVRGGKRAPPYDTAFTNWEYRTLAFTTNHGTVWPRRAEFRHIVPRLPQAGGATRFYVCQLFTLDVGAIVRRRTVVGLPAIKGVAAVSEYRFESAATPVDAFTYDVTNAWLRETDIRRLPEYLTKLAWQRTAIPLARRRATEAKVIRAIFWILLVLGPVALLLAEIRRRQHRH